MAWLDLLKDVPLSAVVKERLAHEQRLHEDTKAKNIELQLQVDELTKEVTALKAEVAKLKSLDEFDDRGGYLWKKGGQGPYCHKCKGSMRRFGSGYICERCR